eukprot:939405-Prorocentrum_lima.AAC.1
MPNSAGSLDVFPGLQAIDSKAQSGEPRPKPKLLTQSKAPHEEARRHGCKPRNVKHGPAGHEEKNLSAAGLRLRQNGDSHAI